MPSLFHWFFHLTQSSEGRKCTPVRKYVKGKHSPWCRVFFQRAWGLLSPSTASSIPKGATFCYPPPPLPKPGRCRAMGHAGRWLRQPGEAGRTPWLWCCLTIQGPETQPPLCMMGQVIQTSTGTSSRAGKEIRRSSPKAFQATDV